MKKFLLLSVTLLATTNVYALEINPYIEGKISQNFMKAEYNELGFEENFKDQFLGGSLEIGTQINQFRIGLEGYYNDEMKDTFIVVPVKAETRGLFLNTYWDIPLGQPQNISPFVGVGIGYSWLKEEIDMSSLSLGTFSAKDKDLSWNITLGLSSSLTENISLTLGYRYEDLGEIKEYESKTNFKNHKVSFGARYTF